MQPAKISVSESESVPHSSDAKLSAAPSVVRTFLRGRGNSSVADGTFKALVFLCALSIFGKIGRASCRERVFNWV